MMIVAMPGQHLQIGEDAEHDPTTIRTTRSSGPIFLAIVAYPFVSAEVRRGSMISRNQPEATLALVAG